MEGTWGNRFKHTFTAQSGPLDVAIRKFTDDEIVPPTPITLPTNRSDTLTVASKEKLYVLTAPAEPKSVRIEIGRTSGATTGSISVRRPDQTPLCVGEFGSTLFVCLVETAANDTIEIGVTPFSVPGALSLQVSEYEASVQDVELPFTRNYSSPGLQVDSFEAQLVADTKVLLTLTRGAQGVAEMQVVEKSTSATSMIVAGSGAGPRTLTFIAPRDGTYQFLVTHNNNAAGTLEGAVFTPDVVEVAALPYFQTGFPSTGVKYLKFNATAGQRIGLYARGLQNGVPQMILHGPLPTQLNKTPSSPCPEKNTVFVAPETGVYYLQLESVGYNYAVSIAEVTPVAMSTAVVGGDAFAALSGKFYTFTRGAEQTYVHAQPFGITACLYAPSGVKLAQDAFGLAWYSLPEPGTYTAIAQTGTSPYGAGTWGFGIDDLMTPEQLTGTAGVYPFDVTISHLGQVELVSMPVTAGDFVAPAVAASGGIGEYFKVREPSNPYFDGDTVFSWNTNGTTWCPVPELVSTSTTLTAEFLSEPTNPTSLIGGYSGRMITRTPVDVAPDVNGVVTATQTLNGLCDFRTVKFNVASPGVYRFRGRYTGTGNAGIATVTTCRKPNGQSWGGWFVNVNGTWALSHSRLDQAGDIYCHTQGYYSNDLGGTNNVTTDLIRIADPEVLTLGAGATAGEIAVPGQLKFYRVTVPATGNFTVTTTGALEADYSVYADSTNWFNLSGTTTAIGSNKVTNNTVVNRVWVIGVDAGATATGSFTVQVTQP